MSLGVAVTPEIDMEAEKKTGNSFTSGYTLQANNKIH